MASSGETVLRFVTQCSVLHYRNVYLNSFDGFLVTDALAEAYGSVPKMNFYCYFGENDHCEASFIAATLLKHLSMLSDNMDPQTISPSMLRQMPSSSSIIQYRNF